MLDWVFRIFTIVLPFLKELVLGDSDVKETIQRNKIVAFLICCFIILFVVFVHTYNQLVQVHLDNTDLAQNNAVIKATLVANKLYTHTLQDDLTSSRSRAVECLQNNTAAGNLSLNAEILGLKQALSQLVNENQELRSKVPGKTKSILHRKEPVK